MFLSEANIFEKAASIIMQTYANEQIKMIVVINGDPDSGYKFSSVVSSSSEDVRYRTQRAKRIIVVNIILMCVLSYISVF
jgi:hypothetical protein